MMTCFIILLSVVALVWVGLLVSPIHRGTFRDLLDSTSDVPLDLALPPLTIVVPARNEADMVGRTIPSLCMQDYPDLRVIVVNDQSDDQTGAILRDLQSKHFNLTVIDGEDRPAGWCGKPWAVQQGVWLSDTPWLLFTDADCVFHPRAARIAMSFTLWNTLDMLSLFPQVTYGGFWEKVGLAGFLMIIAMLFPTRLANNPRSKMAMAAGGFILVRRKAYEQIGGHEAVRAEMIEDINIARRLKESGARVHCRLTRDLVTTRMYDGFKDMWEGLTKNAYAGMEYQPRKFWVGMLVSLLVIVLPPVYLVIAAVAVVRGPGPSTWAMLWLSVGIVLAMSAVRLRGVRHLRLPLWHLLLTPLSAGLYLAIAIASAWQHHYGGGNSWKGRRYTREELLAQGAGPTDTRG